MKSFKERVAQGDILISDGAMGTYLQTKGLNGRVHGIVVCLSPERR